MALRVYGEEERAAALAAFEANGRNAIKTARELGIPRSTLGQWVRGELRSQQTLAEAEGLVSATFVGRVRRRDLAALFETIARRSLKAASRCAKDARFGHLMAGAAIAVDKMRLLREQATTIEGERTIRVEYADPAPQPADDADPAPQPADDADAAPAP